jgi:hypothetical protein
VGLFLNLERCTRGDPSWQMAMAIRTAFELGRASIAGKASKAAAAKLIAYTDALAAGRSKAAKTTAAKKTWWRAHAKLIYEEERSRAVRVSAETIAQLTIDKLYKLDNNKKLPTLKTIMAKIYKWDAARSSLPVS